MTVWVRALLGTTQRSETIIKAMYCLVKNDHIYLLNNVESLKHKVEKPQTEKQRISKNYHTRDKLEVRKYRMIDGIRDILDICHDEIGLGKQGEKLYNKEIVRIHTVLRKDNLLDVVWDCIEQGYEPDVLYQAGEITKVSDKDCARHLHRRNATTTPRYDRRRDSRGYCRSL